MTLRKYTDWTELIGATIEIRRHGQFIRTGTVQDAMPDSSALWIAANGVQGRAIFDTSSSYEAWQSPKN